VEQPCAYWRRDPAYPRPSIWCLPTRLYAEAPFFHFLLAHGKHALVVLKLNDATSIRTQN